MARQLCLIPAHNEAPRIGAVVRGAAAHLPVLVVDDGSADDTAAVAEAAGASVLRQTPNQGKGMALKAGFRWAIERGNDAVVTLDADGQHDPAEIPLFLDAAADGEAQLIIGARAFRTMPPSRRLANTLGAATLRWVLGQTIRDNQSGYRLIRRRLIEAMLESAEAGFEFEIEMIVVAIERGWPIRWVPIRTIYGDESSHIRPLPHAVGFVRTALRLRRRLRGTR